MKSGPARIPVVSYRMILALWGALFACPLWGAGELPASAFLSEQQAAGGQADEDGFDWDRPVVSRGLGGRTVVDAHENASQRQRYQLGQTAYFFGNHGQAFALWQPLAEQGFADAQASLGWLYQAGLGVQQDLQQALHWYRKAAAQGHAVAQNNLGVMYQQGLGVPSDLARAIDWYRKSARQGYRFAQFNLADALARSGSSDEAVIRRWLRAAAEQGVKQAAERLRTLSISPNRE